MKELLLILLLLNCGITYSQHKFNLKSEDNSSSSGTIELSEERYEAFKKRSLEKVTDLGNYIISLTDKSIPAEQGKIVVNLAVSLFQDEEKVVEISSKTSTQVQQLKVRAYFNKLRVLKYSKVDIQWYDIQYVSNLRLGSDGSYYGVITVFQKFTGFSGDKIAYTDITQKNIEIKVMQVATVRGLDWEVLLGNISVVETK